MSTDSNHGSFTWYELNTTDTAGAAAFYAAVAGLGTQVWPDSAMQYTMFTVGSGPMGGLMTLAEEARAMGAPSHWMGVVAVDDTDATLAKAVELGATVRVPAMDIPNVGRWAMFADAQGAHISIIAGGMPPSTNAHELGRVSWHELWTSDPDAAWTFYTTLFGWVETSSMEMGPGMTYRMYGRPGASSSLGGFAMKPPEMPVSAWTYYLTVDNVDTAANRIHESGGRVVHGPMDIPGGGRILMAIDPQGAVFALYAPAPAAS